MRKLGVSDDGESIIVEMTQGEWEAFRRLRAATEDELPGDFLEVAGFQDYDMEDAIMVVWLWTHLKFKLTELQSHLDRLKKKLGKKEEEKE